MYEKERFDLVIRMGETMLRNGGEIFRTNETMRCAAKQLGVCDFNAYVLANGIFASAMAEGESYSCQIRPVPLGAINLGRVEAVNELSRKIAAGEADAETIHRRLEEIRSLKVSGNGLQILSAGVGSACFCYLFGGSLTDAALCLGAGFLLYTFLLYGIGKRTLPKIMVNILSSALVTLYCCTVFSLNLGSNLDKMIIGAIFPLVPGVPITNAVRNFLENDYVSGIIRLVDALLVAGCIAIGVGSVMTLWNLIGGAAS